MYRQLIKNAIYISLIILFFVLSIIFVLSGVANAGQFAADAQSSNIHHITPSENLCFVKAASMYQVPIKVLKSIAKVESNYNPYAINVEGASYMPNNINEAWQIIRSNYYKSFDIGIMQVNNSWFKRLNIPYWYGLNTCYDIMLGAYVLRQKINTYGNNWFGIAAYHSANPIANNQYAWLVYRRLQRGG